MTTAVTKESLAARIAELESSPRSLKEDYTLAAYKMLLATMEVEPVVPDKMIAIVKDEAEYVEGWNDCRAAMLNQVGNSPAQNQGWIPVSERVPEEGGRYWCYVEEQNSLGKSHYQWNCSWNGDVWSDKALTGRVTHWMPLPAAPAK